MKKNVLFIFSCLLVFNAFAVFAQGEDFFETNFKLGECVSQCKADYLNEDGRSSCIKECKVASGFDEDEDFKYEGFEEFEDAELSETSGVTPGSPLYAFDKFFDRFSDVVKVRQEKVAEIKAMVEAEEYEDALIALEEYMRYAKEFEREVSPNQRDEARRSAAAIFNVLRSLEPKIPEEYKDRFNEIIEREKEIVTAAEIASKIKSLCEELSELDPRQYERICKTGDDSPRWQQKLDRDLTDEQRVEAEEFFGIMSECFESSGETCRCEDISIEPFADKCSQIAPLAYACDVENDESACDRMDAIEDEEPIEDLLPDYLRDVLERLEDRFEDDKFDNHAPRECREAGATTREACGRIMFELHAPQECIDAVERGDIDPSNERESREACEALMFELEAPRECLDAGLTNFRECGILMFSQFAPQECLDAGLTGERRSDERACRELVGEERFGGPRRGGPGPSAGFNCQEIENPTERLECYDNVGNQVGSHRGIDDLNYDGPCITHSEFEEKKQECRELYGNHAGDDVVYGPSGDGYECPISFECVDYGDFNEGGSEPWLEGCDALYCAPGTYCEYGECKAYEGYVAPGENGEAPYNCALLDCLEGYYCDPYVGCKQDDGDYTGGGDDSPECDDPTRGGDCVSCASGYEEDGSGGCIPFGTGDYGFEDDVGSEGGSDNLAEAIPGCTDSDADNYDSSANEYDGSCVYSEQTDAIATALTLTLNGNAFLDYRYN